MMRLHIRLAASIFLASLSLVIITLLLPDSGVTESLHSITLGTHIDHYAGGLWKWVNGNEADDDREVRVVVFGDSWADGKQEGSLGRGESWGWVLCQQVNCSAHLSFAESQPSAEYLESPPTGAVTSKQLYSSTPTNLKSPLPDLVGQMTDFLSASSEPIFQNIIFVISFGFWDIYHQAGLDYELGQRMTDASVDELVAQVEILYAHFTEDYYKRVNSANDTTSAPPPFQIIIPKLFYPSLVPGWLTRRTMPPSPSTVAEEQKQAVYLTRRWNSRLENALGAWVNTEGYSASNEPEADESETNETKTHEFKIDGSETNERDAGTPRILPRKDVFHYDLPQSILDLIVEHQLEDAGQEDATGLGMGESPFTSISEPCVKESASNETDASGVKNTVCSNPELFLFWDEFNLGELANEGIGRATAFMVNNGIRMNAWVDGSRTRCLHFGVLGKYVGF